MIATHVCYPGSPAQTRIDVHKLGARYIWRIVTFAPWAFFASLGRPDWCKVRFCPWCGEELPALDDHGQQERLD